MVIFKTPTRCMEKSLNPVGNAGADQKVTIAGVRVFIAQNVKPKP